MKILKEITDWDTPNHTYFTNDSKDKIFAYIKASGDVIEQFQVPLPFRVSGRKFKEVENQWNFSIEDPVEPPATGVKEYSVTGSKGDVYTVSDDHGAWSCTCPASKWQKGQCKHIRQTISSIVS